MPEICKNYERNLQRCNCTYEPCPRKGFCCECIAYHLAMHELPACYFTREEEATYNRSISYFARQRSRQVATGKEQRQPQP